MRKEILRIIDANLNRSREGLRVCEDITRFILNSEPLSRELKSVRHSVLQIVKNSPACVKLLSESRDSEADVLRCSKVRSEMARKNSLDIFIANIERVKESIRVLEEFFKLIDRKGAIAFSSLRFKAYDIEKQAVKKLLKRKK